MRSPVALAALLGQRRGQGSRRAGQPEVGPTHPPLAEQGGDDLAGGGIDRDGQADADAGHRGVDADDFTGRDGQGPAGVPRVEGGVGLDDVVDDPDVAAGPGRQGPAQGADHAGGDAAGQARGDCRRRPRAVPP